MVLLFILLWHVNDNVQRNIWYDKFICMYFSCIIRQKLLLSKIGFYTLSHFVPTLMYASFFLWFSFIGFITFLLIQQILLLSILSFYFSHFFYIFSYNNVCFLFYLFYYFLSGFLYLVHMYITESQWHCRNSREL